MQSVHAEIALKKGFFIKDFVFSVRHGGEDRGFDQFGQEG
jgi:hypothetical protein